MRVGGVVLHRKKETRSVIRLSDGIGHCPFKWCSVCRAYPVGEVGCAPSRFKRRKEKRKVTEKEEEKRKCQIKSEKAKRRESKSLASQEILYFNITSAKLWMMSCTVNCHGTFYITGKSFIMVFADVFGREVCRE